jgi:hypothetical protein
MTPIWATVALSLGAAAITGLVGFGALWWQHHVAAQDAIADRKSEAYQALIGRTLSFALRAHALRQLSASRSGLGDRVDIEMRSQVGGKLGSSLKVRPPVDVLELHDWLLKGFDPIIDAWSTLKVFGSPAAIDAADKLVDACGKCLGVAGQPGTGRGTIETFLLGSAWTQAEEDDFKQALADVDAARKVFIDLANAESA